MLASLIIDVNSFNLQKVEIVAELFISSQAVSFPFGSTLTAEKQTENLALFMLGNFKSDSDINYFRTQKSAHSS